MQVLLEGHEQTAGIRQQDPIGEPLDDDAAASGVISVHDRVDERLPQRFVGRGFVLSRHSIELERHRQGVSDLGPNAAIELEEVRFPGSIWMDAIRPAHRRVELLAVVNEIGWRSRRIVDRQFLAEHQQRSEGRPLLPRDAVSPPTAESLQELDVR